MIYLFFISFYLKNKTSKKTFFFSFFLEDFDKKMACIYCALLSRSTLNNWRKRVLKIFRVSFNDLRNDVLK